jgi:hypothetical protein
MSSGVTAVPVAFWLYVCSTVVTAAPPATLTTMLIFGGEPKSGTASPIAMPA